MVRGSADGHGETCGSEIFNKESLEAQEMESVS